MKYDDGFAAYLNGVEILRINAPTELAWNSQAATNRRDSSAPIHENLDITEHLSALRPGENLLAIHGLNFDSSSNAMRAARRRVRDASLAPVPHEIIKSAIQTAPTRPTASPTVKLRRRHRLAD